MAGFDVYGAIGAVIGAAVDVVSQIDDAKKANRLMEELQKLSDAQQRELANLLSEVKTQIQKEGVIYKYLAVEKHKAELKKITIRRIFAYFGIGAGIAALFVVTVKLRRKYE